MNLKEERAPAWIQRKMVKCDYGIANREMINELQKAVLDLRNHYSNRLPVWATALITLLSSLCVGIIIWNLK